MLIISDMENIPTDHSDKQVIEQFTKQNFLEIFKIVQRSKKLKNKLIFIRYLTKNMQCLQVCGNVRYIRKTCASVRKCAQCAGMCGNAYKIFVRAQRARNLQVMCGVLQNLCARTLRTSNFKHWT